MTKESVARAPRSDSLRMTRSLKVSGPGDLAYRAGLDLGFLRFLGDFVITAAIPPATKVSKSISTFGSCDASGFLCARDSSSVIRLAIWCWLVARMALGTQLRGCRRRCGFSLNRVCGMLGVTTDDRSSSMGRFLGEFLEF